MRYARQSKILELIKEQEISTQDVLVKRLRQLGYDVTQATVSRDIKELGLIKATGKSGRSCYAQSVKPEHKEAERFGKIFQNTVLSIKSSANMIVIKTMSGCANACAEAIDKAGYEEILGTIAGDNTIFIVVNGLENVESLEKKFSEAFL